MKMKLKLHKSVDRNMPGFLKLLLSVMLVCVCVSTPKKENLLFFSIKEIERPYVDQNKSYH